MAIPAFARMYSYSCSTCHDPGYGQLNKFGYKFRAAGYRIPTDIGKEMNDGKFDVTNYIAARYTAGLSATTKTNADGSPTPDNASFTLGGASIFVGGGISKNFFSYSELGLGNGTGIFSGSAPTFSDVKIGYVTGSENDFFTLRIGKFGADGFAGSDRGPVGNATIAGTVRPTGTGAELGYTHDDTRVTLAFYDGIQNTQYTGLDSTSNGTPATTSTLQAPTADSNNAKDIQLFVNQFIGDDGTAINAEFYNGFNGAVNFDGTPTTPKTGGTGDASGQEWYNTALFISFPVIKNLSFKAGGEYGQTGTGIFAANGSGSGATAGFFGEVDYEMDEITPLVFRWDSTTANVNAANADTQKFTLGALTPFVQQVYMNPTFTLTNAHSTVAGYAASYNDTFAFTDSLSVFF